MITVEFNFLYPDHIFDQGTFEKRFETVYTPQNSVNNDRLSLSRSGRRVRNLRTKNTERRTLPSQAEN